MNNSNCNEEINKSIENLNKSMNKSMENLNESMNKSMENLNESMNKSMENLNESMNKSMENLNKSMNKSMENLNKSMEKNFKNLNMGLVGVIYDMEDELEKKIDRIYTSGRSPGIRSNEIYIAQGYSAGNSMDNADIKDLDDEVFRYER